MPSDLLPGRLLSPPLLPSRPCGDGRMPFAPATAALRRNYGWNCYMGNYAQPPPLHG